MHQGTSGDVEGLKGSYGGHGSAGRFLTPSGWKRELDPDAQVNCRKRLEWSVNAEVKENDENVADGFQRSAQKETPREVTVLKNRLATENRLLREASAQYKRLKSEVRALKRRVKSKGHRLVLEVAEAEEARRRVVQHLSPASPEQQMVNGGSNKGTPLLPSPARWGEAELLWWEEEVVGGPPEEEEHKADLLP